MLVIVGILLIFGLVVRHKWRNGAAKKEAVLRLLAVASEQEAEIAKLQAVQEYNLQHLDYKPQHDNLQHNNGQLEAQHYCAVCSCPTANRCSRCKVIRYCSGKCQIIHWRQGHRYECQPASALHARHKGEFVAETAPENKFSMHLEDETKICSDLNEECDDSRSSGSSTSSFFSSTDQSEASGDGSTNEDVECLPALALHARKKSESVEDTTPVNLFAMHLKDKTKTCSDPSDKCDDSGSSGNSTSYILSSNKQNGVGFACTNADVESGSHITPDKTPSVGFDSHISGTIFDCEDPNALSTPPPVYSVNPPLVSKVEKTPAIKIDESLTSTNLKDKRRGGGIAVTEEFVPAEADLGSPRFINTARTSLTYDWENQVQTSTSKVTKSKSSKTSGIHQMPSIEPSLEYSKSSKLPQSHEYKKNENFSGKGLKTSVRKLAQQFRVPKQSKSYTLDMVKDSGGDHNHKVLFPIKLFMQLYSCENVGLHPFGLVNCGNSCYANAVLQCLTFTRPIISYLLQGLHSKSCRKRDWCFICKFEHLIRKGQETNSPLSPVGLLSHIQPIGREEDAHEFLRNVVDKMQSTCLEEAGISGSFAEDSTLIGLTFGGYLRSKIKCMKCLGRSERYDRMLDLTVEIDGDIYTLEQALAQFTMSETLGGDDKYKCNRCKSYEKAKKKLTVLEAPNILTIVLKRFQSGNFEKLNKHILFPENLNLLPYMSGMGDKYPLYHLYAVVVHLGVMNGAYTGHYVSYVKSLHGHWFRIDDSRVSRVDLETVLSAEAYILFYARHTPRGASLVRDNNMLSDGKDKMTTDSNSKKKNQKTKLSSFSRNAPHWMSPNDFTSSPVEDPDNWELNPKHKSHLVDSSSDSSSIFSASDAGSCSTDSTKDSSAEDLSGYLFGSNWYHP